jgi:CNP1-like family
VIRDGRAGRGLTQRRGNLVATRFSELPVLPGIHLACLIFLASPAYSAWDGSEYDFDEETKSWQEMEGQLPPYPKVENLIEFAVSGATPNRHYIDADAVSVSQDGVVRYTVVVRSPAGAETVSFEGIRCANSERKLYAFGHKDGSWSRNRYAKWEPIKLRSQIDYRRSLYLDHFCRDRVIVHDTKAAVESLRRGGAPTFTQD